MIIIHVSFIVMLYKTNIVGFTLKEIDKVFMMDFFCFLEDCTICMEPLGGPSGYKGPGVGPVSRAESVGRLAQCGHQYHFQCLVAMYNNGNKDGR